MDADVGKDFDHPPREGDVLGARKESATRVIVCEDQRRRFKLERAIDDDSCRDHQSTRLALANLLVGDQAVSVIEIQRKQPLGGTIAKCRDKKSSQILAYHRRSAVEQPVAQTVCEKRAVRLNQLREIPIGHALKLRAIQRQHRSQRPEAIDQHACVPLRLASERR